MKVTRNPRSSRLRQALQRWFRRMPGTAKADEPEMTPERWRRATEILDQALAIEPGKRKKLLRKACRGDPALRREVESLLSFERIEVDVLDRPLLSTLPGGLVEEPGSSQATGLHPGQRIGPYEVVRKIGQGGMGTVSLARRTDDFEMQVALKLIRHERLSPELASRFHRERQILADLDHPNIARIYDGGTSEDGLPYFAMEYVCGQPIDRYCDQHRMTIRQRLELFVEVCEALRYSHQRLVVHRDLKPGNILVTESGQPKVVDFGIAKVLDPEADPSLQLTQPGHGPMSTAYASPQQVLGDSITTATDVYSLGVILYELLSGHRPYRLDDCDALQRIQRICEQQPVRPSTVVGRREEISSDRGPTFLTPHTVCAARRDDLKKLRRQLVGDLDSIVLKALRKDPENRYSSVERLAEDIRRHLGGLPVAAREGTVLYRTGKFVRRNRWPLLATTAALSLLFAGTSYVQRLEHERRQAATARIEEANEQAAIRSLFLKNLFTPKDVESARSFTVREVFDRLEEKIRGDLESEPLATQLEILGSVFYDVESLDESLRLFEEVIEIRRRLYPDGDRLLARVINNLAVGYGDSGELDRAEGLYREALDMYQRLGWKDVDMAGTTSNLARILSRRGELEQAEELYRRVLAVRRKVYDDEDTSVAATERALGNVLYLRGDFVEAEPLLRQSLATRLKKLGEKTEAAASGQSSLGRVLHRLERYSEAEELFESALATRRELLGERHEHTAVTLVDLAALTLDRGELARAAELLIEARSILTEKKPDGSEAAFAESLWGAYLISQRQYAEAEPFLVESWRRLTELRGADAIHARLAWERLESYRAQWQPFPEPRQVVRPVPENE